MPDKQGFSATDFIRKQYKKNGTTTPETNRVESDPTEPVIEKKPVGDNHNEQDFLSSDAVKTFIKQNMAIAEDHIKSGRTWEAIGLYKASLQLTPQNIPIQQKLADAYLKVNAREEAIDTLTKLAGLYEREGKMDQANDTYEKIYSLDSKNELACSVLGRKPEYGIPYPDLPFSHSEQEKSIEIEHEKPEESLQNKTKESIIPARPATSSPLDELMKMDSMKQEGKLTEEKPTPPLENKIVESEPPSIKEEFPFPPPPKVAPKTVSQDDIPTVVPTSKPKPLDIEGPKPVEELVPFDTIPVKKDVKQSMGKQPKVESVETNKPVDVAGPSAVEELIPLPPMPEKKVVSPSISITKQEPVKEKIVEQVLESTPESIPVKEEFPLPLPPVQQEQPLVPQTETLNQKPETDNIPESPNERVQYYLDIMAMDPDNIDARLNYINAYLEIGLELELLDDYLELAHCYRNKGKIEEAIKYYQKVLDLDPGIIEAQQKLALLKGEEQPAPTVPPTEIVEPSKEGKDSQSSLSSSDTTHVNQFKRLLQINPLNEQVARKLANFYRTRDMHQEAVYELTMLADAYMQRGMYSKAEPIYEEIMREAPSDELKLKLNKSKNLKKSMDAINQAIKSYKTDLNVVTKKKQ